MIGKGIALGLNKDTTNAEEIYTALKTVLTNSSYTKNVQRLSNLVRDVDKSGLERATFLIEYLMRHNGAPHLKLSSRNLNFFQYYSLDIIFVITLLFYVFGKLCRKLLFCKRKKISKHIKKD